MGSIKMGAGCLWFIPQLVHITFSLGGLLLFMNDLGGSIVVDGTGQVTNYQDFGGGISSLFQSIFIAALIFVAARIFARNYGRNALFIGHFAIVFLLKGAMIWNIYFSGRTDSRIIAAFPLELRIFLPDIAALIAVFLFIMAMPARQKAEPEE